MIICPPSSLEFTILSQEEEQLVLTIQNDHPFVAHVLNIRVCGWGSNILSRVLLKLLWKHTNKKGPLRVATSRPLLLIFTDYEPQRFRSPWSTEGIFEQQPSPDSGLLLTIHHCT